VQGYLDAWGRGLSGPINYYRAYIPRQASLAEALPKITIPTQVIWGEQDSALSIKNLDGLDQHVERLRIRLYPDATHWITDEKVRDLSEDIRSFARSFDAAAGDRVKGREAKQN
jgi:pimeloyl-ACP methyl ester carboxylesterase